MTRLQKQLDFIGDSLRGFYDRSDEYSKHWKCYACGYEDMLDEDLLCPCCGENVKAILTQDRMDED